MKGKINGATIQTKVFNKNKDLKQTRNYLETGKNNPNMSALNTRGLWTDKWLRASLMSLGILVKIFKVPGTTWENHPKDKVKECQLDFNSIIELIKEIGPIPASFFYLFLSMRHWQIMVIMTMIGNWNVGRRSISWSIALLLEKRQVLGRILNPQPLDHEACALLHCYNHCLK